MLIRAMLREMAPMVVVAVVSILIGVLIGMEIARPAPQRIDIKQHVIQRPMYRQSRHKQSVDSFNFTKTI